MGIVAEDIARVRESTDIVGLISERVALKRVGRRYQGLCPFHNEKSASFSVNPELGVYHCFGCQVSGDAITFLRELDHIDFIDAVERLAARAGITTLGVTDHDTFKGYDQALPFAREARIERACELLVKTEMTVAAVAMESLPYLAAYPYGCTEQTMSRFLPGVITAKTLRDLGLQPEDVMSRVFGGIETNTAAATSLAFPSVYVGTVATNKAIVARPRIAFQRIVAAKAEQRIVASIAQQSVVTRRRDVGAVSIQRVSANATG